MKRFAVILLLILAACSSAECKKDLDCTAKPLSAFTPSCAEGKCQYNPIPNVCGNEKCDANENKCSCPNDCGTCAGAVPNSQYLSQQCANKECIVDVKTELVKPAFAGQESSSVGDKFKIDTSYSQPFNLKRDTFGLTITLSLPSAQNFEHKILRAEMTAQTKDKRTITLISKDINKPLWVLGSTLQEELVLDFPTPELEGELNNIALKVFYEYIQKQAGKPVKKQSNFQTTFKDKFIFVKPSAQYSCPPASACDDKNPGTRDTCSQQTNFFCKNEPIPNACGNFVCDSNENKCGCPADCGPCQGSAGNFLDYTCKANTCAAVLKSGVTIEPNSLFDDRSLGPIQLNNNYKFNNPLNIKTDKITLEFKIYRKDPSVENVIIETVRLLEGQQQLAEVTPNQQLSEQQTSVQVSIPTTAEPEEDHNLVLGIWYKYDQSGTTRQGNFQKPLGKITLVNPQ